MKPSNYFGSALVAFALALLLSTNGHSQLTINNAVNSADGVQNILLGPGVTANNITFQGTDDQIGSFTCAGCGLNLGNGIIIGTGNVNIAAGPNTLENASEGPPDPVIPDLIGDADLFELSNMDLNNTAVLEFDFVPTGDSLFFNYVFGSEEYPEWVGSINDAFGFFLSGPGISGPYTNNAASIALIPGSTTPITINNVNSTSNSDYFIDNDFGPLNVQADGFTTVLTAIAEVVCGETYHIKIAIGDATDALFDSWVFLEAGSFQSNQLAANYTAPSYATASGGMFEGCSPGSLTFTRSGSLITEQTYEIVITGSAANGVDYETIPSQIVFPINENEVTIPITPIQDAILEGTENFNIMIIDNSCGNGNNTNLDLSISDLPALNVVMDDVTINCGQQALMTPSVSGGLGNYVVTWETGEVNPTFSEYPDAPTSYQFTVTDTCGVEAVNGVANVLFAVNDPIVVNIGPDMSVTCLDQVDLDATVTGGFGTYTYAWSANGIQVSTNTTITFTESADQNIVLTVTDACEDTGSDAMDVIYPPTPITVSVGTDITATCLDDNLIQPIVTGGVGTYSYSWTSGAVSYGSNDEVQIQVNENTTISLNIEDQCGNTASDQMVINIPAVPITAELGNDLSVTCIDTNVLEPVVSGGIGLLSFEWSTQTGVLGNAEQLSYQTEEDVQITIEVTDECGNTTTDAVNLVVPQVAVHVNIGEDLAVQCIDDVELNGTVDGGIGAYTYTWEIDGTLASNQATLTENFTDQSVVELIVTDDCGNTSSDQLIVSVPPVPVSANAGADISTTCLESTALTSSVAGGVGNFNYSWSDAEGEFSTLANPQYQTGENTTITLTITDACGNEDTDQMNVFIPPVPVQTIVTRDTTICINESLLINGLAEGGVGTLTYAWLGIDGATNEATVAPEQSTTYTFVAQDQCGNQSEAVVNVGVTQVHPNYSAEYVDDFTVAFTNTTPFSTAIFWEFGDGSTSTEEAPVHTFTSVTDWTVKLTAWAEEGCKRSIIQEYKPTGALFVPNCFTPDNDGINDFFFVYGHNLMNYEITIFSKWGDVVYTSDDLTLPWDGSARGGDYFVSDGVYPYVIKAKDERENYFEKSGSIIVLR
jgi:gliding motility-associated-like protein